MKTNNTSANSIFKSLGILKGNTRISVLCEPLWGLPFVLLNFYLSLYMKGLGVTDRQIGYIISIGYVAGTFFSLISGMITDRLGRKKTTFIFDFLSWPLTVFIYLISNSFIMFAIATVLNNMGKIVGISWNLMIVEDADNEQRIAAFNLLNIINIATGVIIPLAGILVGACGVVTAERVFLAYGIVSMSTMIIIRNRLYKETRIGQQILDEQKKNPVPINLKSLIPIKAAGIFKGNPKAIIAALVYILFFVYVPLGTFNSLYFAPFMTEALKLGKSSISVLGGVYSGVMFFVFVFVIPAISKLSNTRNMQSGLLIQALSLLLLILVPTGSLLSVILCIGIYAVGFGIFRPFLDTMLAEVTEGNERAGIYSLINTVTCVATALLGFVSGSIYIFNPRYLYIISIVILLISVCLLGIYGRLTVSDTRARADGETDSKSDGRPDGKTAGKPDSKIDSETAG
ncbi:MAG TPA: MFS transporter [Clostridia bacterium]|nr:MFS transporter [Clostridia bacterium]